jgi:hypothetical protein
MINCMNEVKAHSHLSASSAHRWFNCPGSVGLSKLMPPQPSSPYAEEGTLAHSWLEYKLHKSLLAKEIEKPAGELTEEMEEAIDVAVNYIGDKFMFATENNILIEGRFDLSYIHDGMFGTADFSGITPEGDLYVIDYKHGKGVVVDIEDNKQLLFYAVGAVNHFDVAPDTKVTMVIIQPRAMGQAVKEWCLTAGEIHDWTNILMEKAKEADQDNATLSPGKWCKWCPAQSRCPAMAKDMFGSVAKISIADIKKRELPKVELLTKEELINIIDNKEIIESWLEACYGYLQGAAIAGETVPGYKLVERKGHRKWSNPDEVIKEFSSLGEELYVQKPKELKSPAQLEKLKGIDKKSIASLAFTPTLGLTLVSEEDKRDAVAGVNADQMFLKC